MTQTEGSQLLKKCIDYAEKLNGSHYYGNESARYRELSPSYFAIDQRRLFDSLRTESKALIIVYSLKDGKVIFASGESKNILGWSADKVVIGFSSILTEGMKEWKKALQELTHSSESETRLLAKTADGQEIVLHCQLGIIKNGVFRNYVIGILFPA